MALKDRKTRRYRGSRTCGGGSTKMRRGAGHRGGRGNAGIKKHNKTWYLTHDPSALVHKGPGRPDVPRTIPRSVNIRTLEENAEDLIAKGIAERKEGKVSLDLSRLGYDKLLGAGVIRNAWLIRAAGASKTAARKVSEAGGEILTASESEEESG